MERKPIRAVPSRILVDTNCYLRLYYLLLRPLLGRQYGGTALSILPALNKEFDDSPMLQENYPWATHGDTQQDRHAAVVSLRGQNARRVKKLCYVLRLQGGDCLRGYCASRGINRRSLSTNDIQLLATAAVMRWGMATDEWPLREVAAELTDVALYDTLSLLNLMEESGEISRPARQDAVRAMMLRNESMLRDWRERYCSLFGEAPPEN